MKRDARGRFTRKVSLLSQINPDVAIAEMLNDSKIIIDAARNTMMRWESRLLREREVDAAVREGLARAFTDERCVGMGRKVMTWLDFVCLVQKSIVEGRPIPITRNHISDAWREQHA